MRIFLDTAGLQKCISHDIFWKKLMNVELHQSKKVNQEKGRHGGEERELKINSRWNDEGGSQVSNCALSSEDNSPD